jgi:hypothetical protein
MTPYTLLVMVDSDEDTHIGIMPSEKYQEWVSGEFIDGLNNITDICSLFWSDHVNKDMEINQITSWLLENDGYIDVVQGGLQY